jgi:hypothetical protein
VTLCHLLPELALLELPVFVAIASLFLKIRTMDWLPSAVVEYQLKFISATVAPGCKPSIAGSNSAVAVATLLLDKATLELLSPFSQSSKLCCPQAVNIVKIPINRIFIL